MQAESLYSRHRAPGGRLGADLHGVAPRDGPKLQQLRRGRAQCGTRRSRVRGSTTVVRMVGDTHPTRQRVHVAGRLGGGHRATSRLGDASQEAERSRRRAAGAPQARLQARAKGSQEDPRRQPHSIEQPCTFGDVRLRSPSTAAARTSQPVWLEAAAAPVLWQSTAETRCPLVCASLGLCRSWYQVSAGAPAQRRSMAMTPQGARVEERGS